MATRGAAGKGDGGSVGSEGLRNHHQAKPTPIAITASHITISAIEPDGFGSLDVGIALCGTGALACDERW
jgi:hypothetical protein